MGLYTTEERQNALDSGEYTPVEESAKLEVKADVKAEVKSVDLVIEKTPKSSDPGSSTELLERLTGFKSDAPLCMTCGVKMRPSGACYVCEGCGSTSGCS